MRAKIKKLSLLFLKICIAGAALSYVVYHADVKEILKYLKSCNYVYLLLAFVLLNLSQFISGLRMRLYFNAEGLNVSRYYSVALYFIGMFYNIILPGSIGGDGFIAVHLKHKMKFPITSAIRVIFAGRANGLFFLNLILFALLWFSDFAEKIPYVRPAVIGLFILQIPVYFMISRMLLKESVNMFFKAGKYSFLVQVLITSSAIMTFTALGLQNGLIDYLVMFVASAIAAIFPISPGGVGIRELIFFEGPKIVGLDPEFGVAFSVIFFSIYTLSSLTGLFFNFRLKKITDKEAINYGST